MPRGFRTEREAKCCVERSPLSKPSSRRRKSEFGSTQGGTCNERACCALPFRLACADWICVQPRINANEREYSGFLSHRDCLMRATFSLKQLQPGSIRVHSRPFAVSS